jgi:hypothetical protein
LLKALGVLVEAEVAEVVEDHQLGPLDGPGQHRLEPCRGDKVPLAEGDLGGSLDAPELSFGVVAQHRFGLAQERLDGLGWTAPHEGLQTGDHFGVLDE